MNFILDSAIISIAISVLSGLYALFVTTADLDAFQKAIHFSIAMLIFISATVVAVCLLFGYGISLVL